jgi:hypothetical protein
MNAITWASALVTHAVLGMNPPRSSYAFQR